MSQSCTYTFKGPDGRKMTIEGASALKAYLATGGLEFLLGEARADLARRPEQARASRPRDLNSDEFRAWSGGHPVVLAADASKHQFETGEPVVVEGFHGTRRNFDRVDTAQASAGYFLTSKPIVADEYAGVYPEGMGGGSFPLGGNVQRQYVRMDNPLVVNARGASFNRVDTRAIPGYPLQMSNTDAINQWAKSQGYDGIIYKDLRDSMSRPDGRNAPPSNVYVTFKPSFVKSAIGNSGEYALEEESFLASRDRITETPEFKAWFKDSKVVDAEGKPLVVYHGTQYVFSAFDPEMQGDTVWSEDVGFFFTNDPSEADAYAMLDWDRESPRPNVMPVFLSIQNPMAIRLRNEESPYENPARWYDEEGRDAAARAKSLGHDGLVVVDERTGFELKSGRQPTLYIAFEPTQIKSAIGNSGAFDPTNPNITKSAQRELPRGYVGPVSEEEREQGRLVVRLEGEAYKAWADGRDRARDEIAREIADGASNRDGASRIDGSIVAEVALATALQRAAPGEKYDPEKHPFFSQYRELSGKVEAARVELRKMVDARVGSPEFDSMRQLADFDRRQVRTPEFRRWFRDSKVTDGQGRPLIVFHGTNKDLSEFATVREAGAVRNNNWFGQLGSWFAAPQPGVEGYEPGSAEFTAEAFSELRGDEGSAVYPVYLSIQNPYEVEGYESLTEERDDAGGAAAFRQMLVKQGYDGVVVRESDTDGGQFRDDWVAFYPTQIKSAIGNRGTFSLDDPDITRSSGRDVKPLSIEQDSREWAVDGEPTITLNNARFGGGSVVQWVDGDKENYITSIAAYGDVRGHEMLRWLKEHTGKPSFAVDAVDDAIGFYERMGELGLVSGYTQDMVESFFGIDFGDGEPRRYAGDVRFDRSAARRSAERSPLGLYSALAKGIEGLPTKQAPAGAWKAAIKGLVNKGAAKADEVEWSGVNDWLDLQQGKVSKDQVSEYLKQGGVRVEEVQMGGPRGLPAILNDYFENTTVRQPTTTEGWIAEAARQEYKAQRFQAQGLTDTAKRFFELAEAMSEYAESGETGALATKYSKYTLPGGDNYREVLLRLPERAAAKVDTAGWTAEKVNDKSPVTGLPEYRVYDATGQSRGKTYRSASPEEAIRYIADATDRLTADQQRYRSTHWDQPNVLAHIRVNDRTDADGSRVLFVEELQSDWQADGRRKGFADPTARARAEEIGAEMNRLAEDREMPSNRIREEARWLELAKQRDELLRKADGVPAAPFLDSTEKWLNLALKRVMIMAAEEGYDKVAFVNGEQSADRYDLSKQVSRIVWNPETGNLYATPRQGEERIERAGITAEKLPDIIGKEAAERLVSEKSRAPNGTHVLKDGDLKVGGEGMKTFYDTIVPTALKKLLPKVGGGGVETVEIGNRGGLEKRGGVTIARAREIIEQPGFDITPAMREKVAEGLPLFSRDRRLESWAEDVMSGARRQMVAGVSERLPHPALRMAGLPERPVTINAMMVRHLRNSGHEEITPELISKLRAMLAAPRAVIHNFSQNGTEQWQILASERDNLGRPILVALRPQTERDGRDSLDVVDVRTMFGRADSMYYITKQMLDGNVVYMPEKDIARVREALAAEIPLTGNAGPSQPTSRAKVVSIASDEAVRQFASGRKDWDKAKVQVSLPENAPAFFSGVVFSRDRASWTDDRIDSLLSAHAYTMDDGRSKAYAGFVSPEDFLRATTPAGSVDRLESEKRPLSVKELADEDQPIFLLGEPQKDGTWKTTGHEGRHRMMALRDAGVRRVPVVFDVGYGLTREPLQGLYVTPQRWSGAGQAQGGFFVDNLIPISYKHADDLRDVFGGEGAVRFSPDRAQTETPEFKRWFGNSQIRDESGDPLVVYHATPGDFAEFKPGGNDPTLSGPAMWFTDSKEYQPAAHNIGRRRGAFADGTNVMPAYLKMERPLVIDDKGMLDWSREVFAGGSIEFPHLLPKKWVDEVRRDGEYDGIIFDGPALGWKDAVREYIVFEPTQIKSAIGNLGAFDPTSPDITKSEDREDRATSAWQTPSASKFDDWVYKLQDKQVDTKRVVDEIKDVAGALADDLDVYLQEELFHGRAAKRTEDFVNKELRPLVDSMAKDGLKIEDLDTFLHARHAREANAVIAQRNPEIQDGGSGMTNQDAADYFANLDEAQRRKLEAAAAKVDAIIAETRKMMVDYQLESPDVIKGWGEMFQHYVPLMREDEGAGAGAGIGQGFSIKGREVKSRTGSTRKVVDIFANIAMQRERTIVRGEKNRVSQALHGLATANPNKEFWTVDKVPTTPTFNPATGLVEDRPDNLFKTRDEVIVSKFLEQDDEGRTVVRERAVIFEERNKRAVRMAIALKNMDTEQLEGLMGASAAVTRYFAAINTQYNPVFGIINLIRDVQGAIVNLNTTELKDDKLKVARGTMSALMGIMADARKARRGEAGTSEWSALWEDFQSVGGQTGYRQLFQTSADRAKDIERALNPDAWMDSKWGRIFTANGTLKVPLSVAMKGARWLFDLLSDYNLAMENGIRLSAYKAALDKGMSRERAASLAKNLTVNFNRKGQVGQQAGALYAFFNAAMQGTARLGQTLFEMEPGKPKTIRLSGLGKKIVYGGMLLGTAQAFALALAGFSDDDPPDFVRERSLIIPTGGKTYISIPMPLGLHVIPNVGRVTTEWALSGFKNTPQRVASLLGTFADSFNPIGNAGWSMQTLAPTALDPLVALTENKDWQGRPIAKESMNRDMPGPLLHRDTATSWSKLISESINYLSGGDKYSRGVLSPTPDQIDYLVGQLTGGVGREISKVEQTVMGLVRGEEVPTYKVPLVGRLIGDSGSQASEGAAFYANAQKLNKLETEIKLLREDGKTAEAQALRASRPEAYLMTQANYAERAIQRLRKEKSELIKEGAPREKIREIEERITARMAGLNRAMEALEAAR